MESISLLNGRTISDPLSRLTSFLTEEYPWYDAINDSDPNTVLPMDVLAAVGINAFVGSASAAKLRGLHNDLARICDPLLPSLPVDADLRTFDRMPELVELILASTYARGALSAVSTKILHRKRRGLIPIVDSVMASAYGTERESRLLADSGANPDALRSAISAVVLSIRDDLAHATGPLDELAQSVTQLGMAVGPLRIHDILVWTELEPRGYYRTPTP